MAIELYQSVLVHGALVQVGVIVGLGHQFFCSYEGIPVNIHPYSYVYKYYLFILVLYSHQTIDFICPELSRHVSEHFSIAIFALLTHRELQRCLLKQSPDWEESLNTR